MSNDVELVRKELAHMMPKFKSALPPHITPEKFLAVTMTALNLDASLLRCDRNSLMTEALKCAADGLLPDGREAAFAQFKGKVKYMPMVFGIHKKIKNAGDVATLTSEVIFKNDNFRYWVNENGQNILFEPDLFGERGDPIGVFAIAKTKEGYLEMETLTYDQVMDIKAVSPSSKGEGSPWNGPFASEMWRKSAIRRLAKRLAQSTELQTLLSRDDELFIPSKDSKTIEAEPELKSLEKSLEVPEASASEFEKFPSSVSADPRVVK
jgi:recombination protein RecT